MPFLLWNPGAVVEHNGLRLPRLVFHLAHVAVGLPLALAGHAFHLPVILLLATAFVVQSLVKCLWIDWHRTSGQFLHWTGLHRHEPWDYASDVALTMLGAIVLHANLIGWVAAFYVDTTFNGT